MVRSAKYLGVARLPLLATIIFAHTGVGSASGNGYAMPVTFEEADDRS
jgi:hypothetical protein